MAQTKKKEGEELKGKKASKLSTQKQSETTDVTTQEIVAAWREEISQLKNESFASAEQAVDSIVTKVVGRIAGRGVPEEKMKVFLKHLFESDPALMDEVRRIFKTK
jgi:hypothetical protein